MIRNVIGNIICFAVAVMAGMAAWGCSDSSDEPEAVPGGEVSPAVAERSVLVYMVADNNLTGNAIDDLGEMASVAARAAEECDGRWLVYYSGTDRKPRLIEYDGEGNETVLATYPSTDLSVSVERMRQVIDDFRRLAPARNYGMVLWSHGSGWMSEPGECVDEPSVAAASDAVAPLSFGYDGYYNGKRMKLSSLGRALQGYDFEFLYFDCCHMSTVEVAYELRRCARRMVACPTELGVEGMPYDKNIPYLLKGDLKGAMHSTFDYYVQYGRYGCAIAELDLGKMDALAAATEKILASGSGLPSGYAPVKYFRSGTGVYDIYDMAHYVDALTADDDAVRAEWRKAFDDVVVESLHTAKVFTLDATNFSGLGCHIVAEESDADRYGYRELQWWHDVVEQMFMDK